MLVLSILPLFVLLPECFCTSELVTLLTDSTSGIKECRAEGTVSCHKVAINLAALGEDTLIFPEGKLMTKHQTLHTGFEYEGTDGSIAVLTVLNNRLDGDLNYYFPDKLLHIESCGDGCYVLIESDEVRNQGEVEGIAVDAFSAGPLSSRFIPKALPDSLERQTTTTVVNVMWYYSKQFDDITTDPALYIESLVNLANTAYQNSNLNLELRTMCVERLPDSFVEADSAGGLLNDLVAVKGSESALRQTADIALMVTSQPRGGACGAAYLDAWRSGLPYGWVGKGCQTTVTPHEVGHMMGCCHNPEQSCTPSVSYAYGYWIPGTGKRTIMAYSGPNNPTRTMYFSSPTYQIDGVTAGTSSIDCRRSHLTYMGQVSQLGDESNPPCSTGGTTASPTGPPTTASPPTGCTTVSGPDTGKECVFPFNFNGVTHNACTLDGNAPGETEPWCSTLTDSNDDHVGGQGNWGFCSSNCGNPTTNPTNPTTPAPPGPGQCVCGRNQVAATDGLALDPELIVGGVNAAKNEVGWQVGLTSCASCSRASIYCGGTLIQAQWVMTAAHCTEGTSASSIYAIIGMVSRNNPNEGVTIRVAQKFEHPNWNTNTINNDFSLLSLSSAVDFSNPSLSHVFPACWPTRAENPGDWSIISGWGTTSWGGSQPTALQKANVTIISRSDCESGYPGQITSSMVCAGVNGGGTDSCSGDSGGPLVALVPPNSSGSYELVGATSWGRQCALAGFPGVYSDVFHVLDWVRSTTGSSECPRTPSGTTASPPPVTTTAAPPVTTTAAPPPPPPVTTTASPPTGCTTVSGPDTGKECIFPFNFDGATYNACTFDGNAPGDTEPWCSTLTDSNDDHIGGQGNWGFCSSNCGNAGTTTVAPTTPPTCQNEGSDQRCQRRCNNARRCSRRNYCKRNCKETCGLC